MKQNYFSDPPGPNTDMIERVALALLNDDRVRNGWPAIVSTEPERIPKGWITQEQLDALDEAA